jgi:hypothetical protein
VVCSADTAGLLRYRGERQELLSRGLRLCQSSAPRLVDFKVKAIRQEQRAERVYIPSDCAHRLGELLGSSERSSPVIGEFYG